MPKDKINRTPSLSRLDLADLGWSALFLLVIYTASGWIFLAHC